jgi:toxin ParE1/3/4
MLVWLQRAIDDRDAQLDYIAQDNPMAAVSQGDRIAEQIEILQQHPQMGRPGRKQGTRELVISRTPFIVVYRIKAKRIELLRVLHGAQQWP